MMSCVLRAVLEGRWNAWEYVVEILFDGTGGGGNMRAVTYE